MNMNKIISVQEAVSKIHDNDTIMIGGFMSCGTPDILIDEIINQKRENLNVIANDAGSPGRGIGKLITNNVIKKIQVSHIGLNPEAGEQMNIGKLEVHLIPQGSLVEMIRAAGAGLGGILTPTGIGTEVEEGKIKINIKGIDYLLELPLKADVALIKGSVVDKSGNVFYNATTKNFNPIMASAAKIVIVAAEKIVEVGELDPNLVMTPNIFIDYIVRSEMVS